MEYKIIRRVVRILFLWLAVGGGAVLAATPGALNLQLSLESEQGGGRVVEFQSELQKTLTLDALTVDIAAGFIQEVQTPKTANGNAERQLELALEWVFAWGDLNACWQRMDVRFPEAAKKDKAKRALCLEGDLNGDPLSLNVRFEDAFESLANDADKNRSDRALSLVGQLELGAAELEETVKLKGTSFANDAPKEALEQTFETQLEGPLFEALWTLSRKDVQRGFPNAPLKDNHQTTHRVQLKRAFGALSFEADQTWEHNVFALDSKKNSRAVSLDVCTRLVLEGVRLTFSFDRESEVFENDPIKDKKESLRALEVQWETDRWKVGSSLDIKDEERSNDPIKDKRQQVWTLGVSTDFKPRALFAPQRLSLEVERDKQRFPGNPVKDVLQMTLQIEAKVQLTEALNVVLSSSIKRRQFFNNPTASATEINVDVEVKAAF